MDDVSFQERVKRLVEINKVIEKLDPAIRGQAFALLESYVVTGKVTAGKPGGGGGDQQGKPPDMTDHDADLEAFVGTLDAEEDTPAKNVRALAAFMYKRYGKVAFTTDEMNALAKQAGLTVPDRVDMTMKGAKVKGKKLFQQDGKSFSPTVHGEAFFKEKYKVSKGKLPKPSADAAAKA